MNIYILFENYFLGILLGMNDFFSFIMRPGIIAIFTLVIIL